MDDDGMAWCIAVGMSAAKRRRHDEADDSWQQPYQRRMREVVQRNSTEGSGNAGAEGSGDAGAADAANASDDDDDVLLIEPLVG